MSNSRPQAGSVPDLHQMLDELDRIEELLEDMTELGLSNRDEAEARMRELNARVDELEGTWGRHRLANAPSRKDPSP